MSQNVDRILELRLSLQSCSRFHLQDLIRGLSFASLSKSLLDNTLFLVGRFPNPTSPLGYRWLMSSHSYKDGVYASSYLLTTSQTSLVEPRSPTVIFPTSAPSNKITPKTHFVCLGVDFLVESFRRPGRILAPFHVHVGSILVTLVAMLAPQGISFALTLGALRRHQKSYYCSRQPPKKSIL